jgi:hypothetical protein
MPAPLSGFEKASPAASATNPKAAANALIICFLNIQESSMLKVMGWQSKKFKIKASKS